VLSQYFMFPTQLQKWTSDGTQIHYSDPLLTSAGGPPYYFTVVVEWTELMSATYLPCVDSIVMWVGM
jgi:hypothetical protein